MPMTKDNTKPGPWWKRANEALAERGCREATFGEAHDAYEMGESPETFADYVRYDDDWRLVRS